MPDNHVEDYLRMLYGSYGEKEIELFLDKVKDISEEEQAYILQIWEEICPRRNGRTKG